MNLFINRFVIDGQSFFEPYVLYFLFCIIFCFLFPILGLLFCSISEKASFVTEKYIVLLFSFYLFVFIFGSV